ncbi:hypothetical protein LI90_2691 [Carbonactinospora thermoautotrophica]|uniref:Uncharacterized protein n=1 Tax=Carbonactinospora thermoautotrophica TaxID=1469144 RepID=A0A132MUZ7_9ACTN|nr:hypothetical protein LI90_2691 [Carbonactinospora thermoautotrophica]
MDNSLLKRCAPSAVRPRPHVRRCRLSRSREGAAAVTHHGTEPRLGDPARRGPLPSCSPVIHAGRPAAGWAPAPASSG